MDRSWHGMAGWGPLFMGMNTVLIWLLLIGGAALLYYALRRTDRPADRATRDDGAQRVLADRYARGEIDEDEYHKRLRVLRGA
ncbi:hypothetical protein GCM10009682_03580 [Luedemannella flava]|uniref:SHOCT domain-containing protein n=1 Tax=Luedemannella flava TaxID=349316 RepID=A0ABP4XIZ7_9ACTN